MELIELRNNYKNLNYSIIDIDLHLSKILLYPVFLILITLFSSLMMTTKHLKIQLLKF